MAEAFATTNLLSSLGTSSYTWSNAYAGTDNAAMNDGKLDQRVSPGSPASNIDLVIDLGSAQVMKGIAILNHNLLTVLGAAVTVTVRAATDVTITTGVVTAKSATTLASFNSYSARDPRNKDHLLAWGGSTSKRYWQLQFAYTGTINDFAIGELFAYNSITTLTRGSQYGSDYDGAHSIVTSVQTLSGDRRAQFLAGPIRQKRVAWSMLTDAQKEQLANLYRDGRAGATNVLWAGSYVESSSGAASADQDVMLARLGSDDFSAPMNDYLLHDPGEFVLTSRGREVGA